MTETGSPRAYRTYGKGRSVRLDKATYKVPGACYFVTLCCRDRRRDLAHPKVARAVVDTWSEVTATRGFRLWALCVMPDHLHALLELGVQETHAASSLVCGEPPEPETPGVPRSARPGATKERKRTRRLQGQAPDRGGNVASGLVPDEQETPRPSPASEGHTTEPRYSPGDIIREVKGRSLLRVRGVAPLFWQARFYDHVVRESENPVAIAEYVVNNPVRSALVQDWRQWPWTYVDPEVFE